jgi:hypothetical protein
VLRTTSHLQHVEPAASQHVQLPLHLSLHIGELLLVLRGGCETRRGEGMRSTEGMSETGILRKEGMGISA